MLYRILFSILVLRYHTTNALSPKEKQALKAVIIPAALKCIQQEGLPTEYLQNGGEKPNYVTKSSSCLYACILKDVGLLGQDGNYHPKQAFQAIKPYLDMTENISQCQETLNACITVNDIKVNDGPKGCERALLLMNCMKMRGEQLDILE